LLQSSLGGIYRRRNHTNHHDGAEWNEEMHIRYEVNCKDSEKCLVN
jgi:hypothetical protein